ncbi:MAG: NADP-dependent phosphogluconate dehydrogenase [Acidobacteria bacterium]|nr:NADP-dependent phosphogluconate dehydrogenase [Acidobacteriota bacterium]MBV9475693.1 NADP-dependent phosphogluconate dehydrogenase [Acidobacteriota bacterium]
MTAQFGMIGLAVMGSNLALNIEEHGFSVAVWNREPDRTDKFIRDNAGKKFTGTKTLEEFVAALARPRRIMMMIKAGAPVDEMLDKLMPLLEPGDVVIDGGNSWFKDTQARSQRLLEHDLHFVGSGVSGGEDGARFGPSLMPGGTRESWESIREVFEAIAARSDSGPCVTYCGTDGAGHFVKMVHNGIEYGDMQLIAEAYDLLRRGLGCDAEELARIFDEWNRGPLQSFLIEITAKIFRVRDPETGAPLVEKVLDKAGQKGTGKWTAQVALDLAVPIPTIAAAIDARVLSSMKDERVAASKLFDAPSPRAVESREQFIRDVHDALYAAKICSYAQGMALIQAGSREWKWTIDMREIARIWKAGCIIRAKFLDSIMQAYERDPRLANLLLDEQFRADIARSQDAWRRASAFAQTHGIPVPAFSASLAYFDSYRTAELPQNLTQAQRDLFGAHTYQRNDKGADAPFVHTDWE